jgi:hypothetical protein
MLSLNMFAKQRKLYRKPAPKACSRTPTSGCYRPNRTTPNRAFGVVDRWDARHRLVTQSSMGTMPNLVVGRTTPCERHCSIATIAVTVSETSSPETISFWQYLSTAEVHEPQTTALLSSVGH